LNKLMNTILAGILPDNKTRLFYLQEKVEVDFFTGYHKDLWQIFNRIAVLTGGEVATKDVIYRALDGILDLPIERRAAIEDTLYDIYQVGEVSDADFKSSIIFLEDEYKKNKLGNGLSTAMEILTSGIRNGKELIYGVEPAIESMYAAISEVERVSQGIMPSGNIFNERLDLIKELHEKDTTNRVSTGMKPLDQMTAGGIGAGELWLIAAYAGVGKTFFCANVAYNAAMIEKKNVVYLTAETLRSQVRNRVLTRHTRHPKFGISNGLSSSDYKRHKLGETILPHNQILQWQEVIEDFTDEGNEGIFHLEQVPLGSKISTITAKLNKLNSVFPIDLVIIDSIDLLAPEVMFSSERENFGSVLTSTKLLATTFDNGRGLRILSPWQTSREGLKRAKEGGTGRYDLSSMAGSADAERKADLILALMPDENHEYVLKAQSLKTRDDQSIDFELDVDYDRAYVGSNDRIGAAFELDLLSEGGFADL